MANDAINLENPAGIPSTVDPAARTRLLKHIGIAEEELAQGQSAPIQPQRPLVEIARSAEEEAAYLREKQAAAAKSRVSTTVDTTVALGQLAATMQENRPHGIMNRLSRLIPGGARRALQNKT